MEISAIGVIHSPFKAVIGRPIQSASAAGAEGTAEVFTEYAVALHDLDGYERVWLLYWFDRAP
jgi:tRNA (Thr-GGU) A37 N-methylase